MTGKLKITFGAPPATFVKEVKHTLADGAVIKFDVTFRHRTRTQYGELMDEISSSNSQLPEQLGDAPKTLKSVMEAGNKSDVESILKMAEGWSLQDEFTAENLLFINDNYPGVIVDISEAYRDACLNGRLKN